MEIADWLAVYPQPSSRRFNQGIFDRLEFNELRLSEIEVPEDDFLQHQKLVQRLMSPEMTIDGMLAFHSLGSGKTCTAIAFAEAYKLAGIRKIIVITRGPNLTANFQKELLSRCPRGVYTSLQDVKEFYKFTTFITFANRVKKMTDQQIEAAFSSTVFIVDEVHHIHLKNGQFDQTDTSVYTQMHRVFHIAKDRRVLLLTGTPMVDNALEIVELLNLILPIDEQLSKKELKTIITSDSAGTEFKRRIQGRVSYLRSMSSDAKKNLMSTPGDAKFNLGGNSVEIEFLKPWIVTMSDFQTAAYKRALGKDGDKTNGIYTNSQQAGLFVFPDGSWGKDGYKKYVTETKVQGKSLKTGKPKTDVKIVVSSELKEAFKDVAKYSAKYAELLHLLKSKKGKSFVYSEWISGGGVNLLRLLLKENGYPEYPSSGGFGVIIGGISKKRVSRIIAKFNSPDNLDGSQMPFILGSRAAGEGISLMGVRNVHILTPFWNNTSTEQAIGRAFRLGAHKDLPPGEREVDVYRYAIDVSPELSVDLRMLIFSEAKDIPIKKVERLLKESAVDCALNYARNVRPHDTPGTPDCDYADNCEYRCFRIRGDPPYDNLNQNLSTYMIYYTDEFADQIREFLRSVNREVTFPELQARFGKYGDKMLISALLTLQGNNDQILHSSGYPGYLAFGPYSVGLSPIPSRGIPSLEYFKNRTYYGYRDISDMVSENSIKTALQILDNCGNPDDLPPIFRNLYFEELLKKHSETPTKNTEKILKKSEAWKKTKIGIVSSLQRQLNISDKFRCLDGKEFRDCSEKERKQIQGLFEGALPEKFKDSPYGVYGLYEDDKFKIRVFSKDEENETDLRKVTRGKACSSYSKPDMAMILLKLPHADPPKKVGKKQAQQLVDDNNLVIPDKDIVRIGSFLALSKVALCQYLEKFFNDNDLML